MADGTMPVGSEVAVRTKVFVRDLRVEALIGVLGHEQGQRQPLFLDVEMDVLTPDADDLDQALDYRLVGELAEDIAATQIGLVEVFAEHLARRLLDRAPVQSARVHLRKPQALTNGLAGTEVTLARTSA
ncbi:dihydroneopterin aldolase [Pseudooceanicola marinus]|uniref:dihydroneopterin aldolase n=1 Tax=Pseudooceanicola marinus TaxID=396013 RepID=UPI001CD2E73A|nr:dihydroneopterin aldolase [Pseudooceanicola marinus]MCA1335955.1 dihydroneopterin aldolase [Pseudooceanicola marinus]